jgi:16S rRNA (cytosine967-C5)-methyltransferase
MTVPARIAAYEVLSALRNNRADLPTAIAAAREELSDSRDRSLASEIATGVQRWRGKLDYLVAEFAKRPIDRLDPEVLDILRLSVYQLLHLTRVPASAVVDDAVDLVRRARKRSATGFVNAVLRSISRSRASLPLPQRPADLTDRDAALRYFAVTLSHPRWLVARLHDRLGFEATEAWLRFDNAPAALTLRANRLRFSPAQVTERLQREGVRVHPGAFSPDALIVDEGNPLQGQGLVEGWFVVQDEASQLVALLAGDVRGSRVLDACASPGGKTTAIAGAMDGAGFLVASDLRDRRIELLRRTVVSCSPPGAMSARLVQADMLMPPPFSRSFDVVLVDAPCSGLGTLRRDPDIRWRRQAGDLEQLAAAELRMLRHAAEVVAPGGRLIYATCSSEPEENEHVVESFLAGNRDFTFRHVSSVAAALPRAVVDDRGYLRTQPHLHELEAFFGAVVVRSS